MIKYTMNIWGRKFELPVMIKQYDGEEITEIQKETVEKFQHCEEVLNASKQSIEQYILENGLRNHNIYEVDNIFKYVMPKSFYVPNAEKRVIVLFCNFKYDLENGIALVFVDEKLKEIIPEDLAL
mgnify:FL=1